MLEIRTKKIGGNNMKTIYIYNKNDFSEIIEIPSNSIQDFENNKVSYFPLFQEGVHFYFDEPLKYPIFDGTVVREMTEAELISEGLLKLQEGEILENGKVKKKEKPNEYSKWNKETGIWEENIADKLQFLKDERQKKQREFVLYKKELENLEQEKLEFEELGFDTSETEERITEINLEMNLLKDEIAKLNKEISKIKI